MDLKNLLGNGTGIRSTEAKQRLISFFKTLILNKKIEIKFSLDGGIYPKKNHDFPEKIVNLETGDIVLFPSSIFHSTIPFSSKKNRITLAFDVRPKDLEEVR